MSSWWRWLGSIAIVVGGGAIYSYLALFLAQVVAEFIFEGRLLRHEAVALAVIVGSLVISGLVMSTILRRFFRWRAGPVVLTMMVWLVTFVLLWLIGSRLGGISPIVYGASWLLLGGLGGLMVGASHSDARGPTAAPKGPSSKRRRTSGTPATSGPQTLIKSRQFGRVAPATVVVLDQQVSQVRTRVVEALPVGVSTPIRSFTTRAVLDRTLADWWRHGNTTGLLDKDIADLRSFIGLAVALAAPMGLGSDLGQAVYRACLNALLDDWLEHWNSDGRDGPPPL